MYTLTVLAVNLDAALPLNDTVTVTISVTDINDQVPTFDGTYNTQISELSPYGTFVLAVSAIDGDQVGVSFSRPLLPLLIYLPFSIDAKLGHKIQDSDNRPTVLYQRGDRPHLMSQGRSTGRRHLLTLYVEHRDRGIGTGLFSLKSVLKIVQSILLVAQLK